MGCDKYNIENVTVTIPERDEYKCLCTTATYPSEYIDHETVYYLAMLGYAVLMIRNGYSERWLYLPEDIPLDVRKKILEALGD